MYGEATTDGIKLFHDDGTPVTRIEDCELIYPVGSNLSCAYEHVDGIVVTMDDFEKLTKYVSIELVH
jgi:hypothetical protein